jgi:hypothetical protein
MSVKLSERAMLVNVSVHGWTGQRKNGKASQEYADSVSAAKDAVSVLTSLIPKRELDPIRKAGQRAYTYFIDKTLPWMDGGYRILPSEKFFEFRQEIAKLAAEYQESVEHLAQRWPEITSDANLKKRLGDLYGTIQIPQASDLKWKFRISRNVMSLPEVSDFRVKFSDAEFDEAKAEIEETWKEMTVRAMSDLWSGLAELVENIAATMSKKDKKFRNSMIQKVRDFCDKIPSYNLMDDPQLEKIRLEVKTKLAELDPEDLREIPNKRKQAAEDAEALLKKIKGYAKV